MKVTDIRSFFNKPGGSTQRSSRSASAAPAEAVEVPSRLKKGGSKKKSKEDDHLKVTIEKSDDSDREDPLPKKARKGAKDNGKSKSRKPVIDDDDEDESDGEDPIPKAGRNKHKEEKEKSTQEKKRKARVLSDSDEDDFKSSKVKSTAVEKPAAKVAKVEKVVESKKKQDLKSVNPADFFGAGPIKRETNKDKDKKGDDQKATSSSKPETPEKKKDNKASPQKEKVSTPPSSSKAKHNGTKDSSPHRPPTSLIEPKKLKMPTQRKRKNNLNQIKGMHLHRPGRLNQNPRKRLKSKNKLSKHPPQ